MVRQGCVHRGGRTQGAAPPYLAAAGPVAAPRHVRYRREVEFTAHQDQMALQRLRDQGGFNGDRIADCALSTVYASGSDWLKVVVEKTDLSQSNLAGTRIREAMFAHTSLRKARLRGARMERVELYFCDLNEMDASEISARRTKVHGSEAMNAVFSGAQLAVTRFEDTKLYRARFDQALLVRVVFLDSRLGGPSLEKADFSGARLVDVTLRAANLQGASFAGATLVGVDFTDAALEGADFRGAVAIGCRLPAGFSPRATTPRRGPMSSPRRKARRSRPPGCATRRRSRASDSARRSCNPTRTRGSVR